MEFDIVSGMVFIGTRMHAFRRCPVLELEQTPLLDCHPFGRQAPADGFQFLRHLQHSAERAFRHICNDGASVRLTVNRAMAPSSRSASRIGVRETSKSVLS